jgi:TatD DNase family protein
MRIFESHCHLDDSSYAADLEEVMQRARSVDVRAIMVVGTDVSSSCRAVQIAGRFPDVFAAVGLHPHDAGTCSEAVLEDLKTLTAHARVKAWGETGLDFNRMHSPQKDQEHWFHRQLETAGQIGLPMIFHERDSQGRFLEILRPGWGSQRRGVVHCFSGDEADLEAYLELGLSIGITGILTIQTRGEALRRMVRRIPAHRLVVETDAPYLTPSPQRNKFRRNEPAFVRTVLLKLAQVRQEDPEQLAAAIWSNTCALFGLPENL